MCRFAASFNNRAYTNLFKFSAYNLELRNIASQKEEENINEEIILRDNEHGDNINLDEVN